MLLRDLRPVVLHTAAMDADSHKQLVSIDTLLLNFARRRLMFSLQLMAGVVFTFWPTLLDYFVFAFDCQWSNLATGGTAKHMTFTEQSKLSLAKPCALPGRPDSRARLQLYHCNQNQHNNTDPAAGSLAVRRFAWLDSDLCVNHFPVSSNTRL